MTISLENSMWPGASAIATIDDQPRGPSARMAHHRYRKRAAYQSLIFRLRYQERRCFPYRGVRRAPFAVSPAGPRNSSPGAFSSPRHPIRRLTPPAPFRLSLTPAVSSARDPAPSSSCSSGRSFFSRASWRIVLPGARASLAKAAARS